MHVAAYIEQHPGSPQTIKQHLAAIRMLFSWLTEKGVLAMNPAWEVKTERFSRTEGKTLALCLQLLVWLRRRLAATSHKALINVEREHLTRRQWNFLLRLVAVCRVPGKDR
jgi:site-specific recombinase XerC